MLQPASRLYYLSDANYNVTAVVGKVNDTWQAVERYAYTAYGKATIYTPDWSSTQTSSLYGNATLYTGRELDASTSLYYYRARYYSADLGSFVGRDPIGYRGGINLYEYVTDSPLTRTDPTGMIDLFGPVNPLPPISVPPQSPAVLPPNVPRRPLVPVSVQFLRDFVTGLGDDVRCYRENEVPLEEMKKSPGAEKLRREFYRNCGRDTQNVSYGSGLAAINTTLVDGTWFMVTGDQVAGFGGASATVNADGTVTFTIRNTAGTHSFFYHMCPDRPTGSAGPMRTIYQTFQWTEPIDRQRCILTPRSRIDPIEWGRPAAR